MCFEVISMVMGAVSAVAGFAQQQQAADAQTNVANLAARNWERNQRNALQADRENQEALTTRQLQEQDATGSKLHAQMIDTARREAEAEVSGAAAGSSGISLDNLVADIGRRAEDNRVTTLDNYNATVSQYQLSKKASVAQGISRVNSLGGGTPGVAPDFMGTAFKVAGSGLRYFGDQAKKDSPYSPAPSVAAGEY